MQVIDILRILERWVPLHWAESWDHCGLLIGAPKAPISRILVALDATTEALSLAERLGSELILTHHPLLFHPMQTVLDQPPIGHLVTRCIQQKRAVLALHTNLDACLGGVNDALALQLHLIPQEPLIPLSPTCVEEAALQKQDPLLKSWFQKLGLPADAQPGWGRICRLPEPCHAKEFLDRVRTNLQSSGCMINFDKDKTYRKILVWGGALDDSVVPYCVEQGVDCVVAGEIHHHTLLAFAEQDIHAIAAGHDATERVVLPYLEQFLKQAVPECRVAIYPGLSYNNVVC